MYWIVRCIFLVSSSMARNLKRSHSFSYVCANIERDLIYSSSYQKKQFFLKCTLSVFHRLLLLLFQSKAKNISFRRRTDKTTTIASFLPSMKFHVKYEIILDIFIWLEEKVHRHGKHTHTKDYKSSEDLICNFRRRISIFWRMSVDDKSLLV